MADVPATLSRQAAKSIGLDFDTLTAEGIALLQQLSGEIWSDYNEHDPGVTTLQQLVYGLTDLAYRTEFEVADYLTGDDGRLDYERLALYPPHQIFPRDASTIDDYRRLLYDAIPDISEIWVRSLGRGLISIDVMRDPAPLGASSIAAPIDEASLRQLVHRHYAEHRPLGEDLDEVRIVKPQAYYLQGEIDIEGGHQAAEILAQLLFNCNAYLSSGMGGRRLQDLVREGWQAEAVFDGPSSEHGYVTAQDGRASARTVTVSELIGEIVRIRGVLRVRSLFFVDANLRPCADPICDPALEHYPWLPFPQGDAAISLLRIVPAQGIEYGVREQTLPVAAEQRVSNAALYEDAYLEYEKLQFQRRAFRTEQSQRESCFPLPSGQFRKLHEYYTAQNDYPATYGIGKYGLPMGVSPERRAQAEQLKGFLFPFEQLMANYLQNLQSLPTLFSPDDNAAQRSYFFQYLDSQTIPNIEALYTALPDSVARSLDAAVERHDNFPERKGRVYDYLLALYGESFSQHALRRFNQCHPSDTDYWLLDLKARLLRQVVELTGSRARGFNYTLPSIAGVAAVPAAAPDSATAAPGVGKDGEINVSRLVQRVAILLGFHHGDRYRTLAPWRGEQLLRLIDDSSAAARADMPPTPAAWQTVPGLVSSQVDAQSEEFSLPDVLFAEDALPASLFRHGALLTNYRLAVDGNDTLLYCRAGAEWLALQRYPDAAHAIAAAHGYVAELLALNRRCEGMHLVEHLLLRAAVTPVGPTAAQQEHADPLHYLDRFFASRISVILPAWTIRGANHDFRNFVEETVRQHCPAHLYPTFLWLTAADMVHFERVQAQWLESLRKVPGGASALSDEHDALRRAAAEMVSFLQHHRSETL